MIHGWNLFAIVTFIKCCLLHALDGIVEYTKNEELACSFLSLKGRDGMFLNFNQRFLTHEQS